MDILDAGDDSSWSIFPLTDGLSGSYVDPSNLVSIENGNHKYPIGMENFKSQIKGSNGIPFKKPSALKIHDTTNSRSNKVISRWKLAVLKAKMMNDPWMDYHIEKYSAERVIRHRYNAIKKKWIQDECVVKMEEKQFANGAMRACFRLKKLSHFTHKTSWEHASNYVAKCYMDSDTPRERYFDDVKLQMDAKLWAECYNRHNPPKKVDMFQVTVAEFIDRPNSPLYHLEHYIEGKYIKYNSNSGYVDDCLRSTPHAFSHFTFECSDHEIIVVDIQGVGDLYTDPQIHTARGTEYGDGNLGTKGMALFFHSHVCNDICKSLGLTPFDLADTEKNQLFEKTKPLNVSALTISKGHESVCVGSPTSFGEYFFKRSQFKSQSSLCSDENNSISNDFDESEGYESSTSPSAPLSPTSTSSTTVTSAMAIPQNGRRTRVRTQSSCLDQAFSPDDAASFFRSKDAFKPRPSCVINERGVIEEEAQESILGLIHFDLCKYHEMGRFVNENEEYDRKAAFFHLQQAANLGVLDALLNISKIYLDLPHDILSAYKLPESDENKDIAFDYILHAAEQYDRGSMLYVAKAYDTGVNLHRNHKIDWEIAVEWYGKALNGIDEETLAEDMGYSDGNEDPPYVTLARMAEMYAAGGNGIEQNQPEAYDLYNEAAEKATLCGKGRLANKYYMLAESVAC